jgi:ABC-type transporter Mla subunit MlaD
LAIDPPPDPNAMIVQAQYARYRRDLNGSEVLMTGTAEEGFGAHPFAEIARATVAAQERSLELAATWTESLRQLVSDQAEGGRAVLEALSSTLAATEQALASQEAANRALRQSLEAYRDVVERAGATQERSTRLLQVALETFTATTQAQLELARAMVVPLGAQPEAFGKLVQSWNDAFLRLLEAAPGAQPRRRSPDG